MVLKQILKNTICLASVLTVCGCEYFRTRTAKDFLMNPAEAFTFKSNEGLLAANTAEIRAPRSIVVCRSHQCAPSKLSMSKEYIYNSLLQLFENNNYSKALICQADSNTHTCLENYITMGITAGITPTNAYIDHVKITDVIVGKKVSTINLILNYNLTYGGQTAECTPAQAIVYAKNVNHVLLEDSGYNCKMTSIGQTSVKTVFAIDYIDLDYGYIGGYFSIGLSGPAYGGGSGYMLLRLQKNAYPLSPKLSAPQTTDSKQKRRYNTATSLQESSSSEGTKNGGVQIFPISK